ncbi:MAG: hypothetical protein HGA87_02770 [Desulfobulbaceae bacterium]|nr:hypothetical protein [Desulfobulbaceae bacterium]
MARKEKIINFDDFLTKKETSLVGRENGEALLKKSGIAFSAIEKEFDLIVINIPDRIVTMNKSFFLGFFELSVQRLGKDEFFKKYQISASTYIISKLDEYAVAALLRASQREILDV